MPSQGTRRMKMARHNRTGRMYKVEDGILYSTDPMFLPNWIRVTRPINQSFLNDINGFFGTDFRMNEFRG